MRSLFVYENNIKILRAAALYSILWGLFITLMPKTILNVFGVQIPDCIEFWQCIGMIVGVAGIGYFIASFDPEKHWPIVFIGLVGNILVSVTFTKALIMGSLPPTFSIIAILSSIVWVLPFYYILLLAFEVNTREESTQKRFSDLIKVVRTSQNQTLMDLSNRENVLLVFVRHFGCTFCRETVSEMAKIDKAIKNKNLTLVFVHMSDPGYGDEFFSKYYEEPVHHISDPTRELYKNFNLKRGTIYQLFGLKTWINGLWAGIVKGHGIGAIEGDSLQLGGVFILSKGQIVFEQKANYASHIFEFKTLPEM